jgi:mgtE-like transporter
MPGRGLPVIATGLLALVVASLAESGAGIFLGSMHAVFAVVPGLLILVPASIDMRGNISGSLVSRLASSMHLGEFEVDLSSGSVLGENIRVSLVCTVILSLAVGVFAAAASWILGLGGPSLLDFVIVSVASGAASGLVLLAFTYAVSVISFRHGLDLDMIGAPAVTAAGDIVTLPILVGTALFVVGSPAALRVTLGAASIVLVLFAVAYALRRPADIRSAIGENVALLVPLGALGIAAGVIYTMDAARLVGVAALLILIPPFMGICGSIGGILASRFATAMHTGAVTASFPPGREVVPYLSVTYIYALVLLPFLGIVAHAAAIALGLASPGLLPLMLISLVAGITLTTLVCVIAYGVAALSFSRGLDPDNFGIPVITTVVDALGAAVLIATIGCMLG